MTDIFEKNKKLLEQYLRASLKHLKRIEFAKREIKKLNIYKQEELFIMASDQIIYRFGQLQDQMAKKIFPSILKILGEDENSFIDIFDKLEKMNFLDIEFNEWQDLRDKRNNIHEYEELSISDLKDKLDVIVDKYVNHLEKVFIHLFGKIMTEKHLSSIIDEDMKNLYNNIKENMKDKQNEI